MSAPALKVGELARRTGLTVRTLHFYEEIGLLAPDRRSAGRHRLYGPAEIERHRAALGPVELEQTWREWSAVVPEARDEHARGTPPTDPRARAIGQRWSAVLGRLMPSDPAIRDAASAVFRERAAEVEERFGLTAPIRAWLHASAASPR